MPRRTRTTGGIRALALATVVLALLAGTLGYRSSRAAAESLAPGAGFTVASRITSSPTSADAPALLYPGATRYLWYSVHNPLPQAITVTKLGIAGVQAPTACPEANLDLTGLGLTGAFIVPAGATATVLAPRPLSLRNRAMNQDSCKGVTFRFTFTGSGWYSSTTPPDPEDPDPPTPPNPGGARVGTATQLAVGPSPAALGQVVTLTARVARTTVGTTPGTPAVPTGTVSFHRRTATGAPILLGKVPLDPRGTATLRLSTLLPGRGRLYATYAGTTVFAGSTSSMAEHRIIAPPALCTGRYSRSIIGRPTRPVIRGTSGNDFIYAVGGNYRISAGSGNDCIVVGDGTNVIADGAGADVVLAGHGRNTINLTGGRNTVVVGDGSANRIKATGTRKGRTTRYATWNRISLGDGSANRVTIPKGYGNQVTLGNGSGHRITVSKGSKNAVRVGNGGANRISIGRGTRNRITLGNGSRNQVAVGTGSRSTVTLGNGSRNRITAKGTRTTVTLGTGTRNRVVMPRGRTRSTCSLPAPPPSWRGSTAGYYRDTLIRCKVVKR